MKPANRPNPASKRPANKPIQLQDHAIVTGRLLGIVPIAGGLIATIGQIRVLLPTELLPKLQELQGQDVVVENICGEVRAERLPDD